MTDRTAIFDAIRAARDDRRFLPDEVSAIDDLLDRLGVATGDEPAAPPALLVLKCGAAGIALIQSFEDCQRERADGLIEAYPDPGRGWGLPTIGWGSTGPDVKRGTVWTRAQCDARFARDIERVAREVRAAIGATPTTQTQFDALVSFHYNSGAIGSATLTKLHRAGNFAAAANEFARWNKAKVNGVLKVLSGLTRRRAAEAALYRGTA